MTVATEPRASPTAPSLGDSPVHVLGDLPVLVPLEPRSPVPLDSRDAVVPQVSDLEASLVPIGTSTPQSGSRGDTPSPVLRPQLEPENGGGTTNEGLGDGIPVEDVEARASGSSDFSMGRFMRALDARRTPSPPAPRR